jgi:hypothetical protein
VTTAAPGRSWRDDLAAAVPAWVVARLVVAAAWVANAVLVDRRFDGVDPVPTAQGLFAWDGAYYRAIAEVGYAHAQADGIRFHPLVPLLGWNGTGILLLANAGALLAAALVHRLVVTVLDDADAARRAATLVGIAPPAFVLVMAYTEGPFIALAAGHLLALHRRRWWAVAVLGALATLTRPAGLMLAVPAAWEAWSDWRRRDGGGRAGPIAAVLAPVVAMAGFLGWVEQATGDWAAPLRVQEDFRGGFVLLPVRLVEGLGEVFTDPFGDGLHVPFAFGMVALTWVCWRRLPASWTALAVVSVLQNLSAGNLNSTERYAYATVPLLVAGALVAGGKWWRPVVALSTVLLLAMTVVAWQGDFVP